MNLERQSNIFKMADCHDSSTSTWDLDFFPLLELPEDLLRQVCLFLHGADVLALAQTCRSFNALCEEPSLWLSMITAQFGKGQAEGVEHDNARALRTLYFDLAAYKKPARELAIVWGDHPQYWSHQVIEDSEFSPCAILRSVCWLDVRAEFPSVQPGTYCAQWRMMFPPHGVFGFNYRTTLRVEVNGHLDSVVCAVPCQIPFKLSLPMIACELKNYVDPNGFQRLAQLHLGEWFDFGCATFTITQLSHVKISIENHSGDWKTGLALDYARLRLVRPALYRTKATTAEVVQPMAVFRPFMNIVSAMAHRFLGDEGE